VRKRRDARVVDPRIERNAPRVVPNLESVAIESAKIANVTVAAKIGTRRVDLNTRIDQKMIEKIERKKKRKRKRDQK